MTKRNHSNPATKCKCQACGTEAQSIVGTRHRRCGGATGAGVRPRDGDKLPSAARGVWGAR
jgi:hypothetical protein